MFVEILIVDSNNIYSCSWDGKYGVSPITINTKCISEVYTEMGDLFVKMNSASIYQIDTSLFDRYAMNCSTLSASLFLKFLKIAELDETPVMRVLDDN